MRPLPGAIRSLLGGALGLLGVCAIVVIGGGQAQAGIPPSTCFGETPTITGTDDDDSGASAIEGTTARDVILALGGDDEINGLGGHDLICGGIGDDEIDGGAQRDTLLGEAGADTLIGGTASDTLFGGSGNDTCNPGAPEPNFVLGCTPGFQVGQSAPELIGENAFTNRFRLSDLRGQNVLLDFTTRWCAPSNFMMSRAASIQRNLRDAGVPFSYVIVMLESTGGTPAARADVENYSADFGLGKVTMLHPDGVQPFASPLYKQFGNYSLENAHESQLAFPTHVFIDENGVVEDVGQGSVFWEDLEARYGVSGPDPEVLSRSRNPRGRNIDPLVDDILALDLDRDVERALTTPILNAVRTLDPLGPPLESSCTYLHEARRALVGTDALFEDERADFLAQLATIRADFGCT